MTAVRRAWLLALLLLSPVADAASTDDAAALLSLPRAIANWADALAANAGAAWQEGTPPCGDGGSQVAWAGVTCSTQGQVTALNLSGLGLEGTLPPALAQLPALTSLDLSANRLRGSVPPAWLQPDAFPSLATVRLGSNLLGGPLPAGLLALATDSISLGSNALTGALPPGWASATLKELDLSGNDLNGTLPASWGGAALPALQLLGLQGNQLEGGVPMPDWTYDSFPVGVVMQLRPGNDGLCGPVMPLDPELFPAGHAERNLPIIPVANQMHTGQNLTHIILTQPDLFTSGTDVTLTNWLGSCMSPCKDVPGGLTTAPDSVQAAGLAWPPAVQTNIYDISWVYNMSISDLVALNTNASQLHGGAPLSVPCYPNGNNTFRYYGGSLAFGKFSGGNQLLGPQGLPGAMAAARVNGGLPNTFHWPSIYIGNAAPDTNGSTNSRVVEPVYWFVDLQAEMHVTNVLITAGGDFRNTSVYVGSNTASVAANTRVASGLGLAAGQQLAVPGLATKGRYVIIYTGTAQEGTLNLDDVQVYAYETNAAAFKPITASEASSTSPDGAPPALAALVDNSVDTCVKLQPAGGDTAGAGGRARLVVDLGYTAMVGSIAVRAGPSSTAGSTTRVYVTQTADTPLADSVACNTEGKSLLPGAWTSGGCNKPGRYVTVRFSGVDPAADVLEVCEFQVALAAAPTSNAAAPKDGGGGGLSGGAVAGIVIGSTAGLALLCLLAVYLRWRWRWMRQQRRQLDAIHEVEAKEAGGTGLAPVMEVDVYGDGDEEEGCGDGGAGGGPYGNGAVAVAADGVVVSRAGRAVAPVQQNAGWDKPTPQRLNEFQLIGRFFSSLRHGGPTASLSQRSSQESGSRRRAGFSIVKGGATEEHANATTDLTKLPPGFLEVSPSDIKLVECVGEGSFGEVWLAEYCGALVAVKILAKVKSDFMTHSMQQQLALRNLQKEAMLMSKLRHPNVCLYLGAVTNPPCLVMEYCAKCSLDHLLRAGLENPQMAKRLSWVRLLSMALDAAKGMLYLHTRAPPIAHRDLKSANLLVDSQWRVKVADFSLSRALEIGSTAYTVVSTNPRWLAPEVLSGHPGQLPADVWAFGTVLWEMCTWRLPFENLNTFQIIAKVQSQGSAGLVVPPAEELPGGPFAAYPQFVTLMKACWEIDPEQRPTFAIIKEMLGDMLTAEMLPHQQAAAAAAAAEKAARAAVLAANGPALAAMDARLREQQAVAKRNSYSSSERGASLADSLGRAGSGSWPPAECSVAPMSVHPFVAHARPVQ